jgi:hypothetical protein
MQVDVFWDITPRSLVEVLEVLAASIRALIPLMMEAACTSKLSVNFYQITRRNNPEDSLLHTRRCENLKSHVNKC